MRKYHCSLDVIYREANLPGLVQVHVLTRNFGSYSEYCLVRDSLVDFLNAFDFKDYNIHSSVVPYDFYGKEVDIMAKMRYAQSRGVSRRQFKRTAVKTPVVNVAPPKRGGIRL